MKISINSFVAIILITIGVILNGSMIAMHLEITNARRYHTSIINRIESSNFSNAVINEVKTQAANDGYPTTITNLTVYEDKTDLLVSTKYTVSVPILGVVKEGTVEGYAR